MKRRSLIGLIILILVSTGCVYHHARDELVDFKGRTAIFHSDGSVTINGRRWSKEDADLLVNETWVIPKYLLLEGETERDAVNRIISTLPDRYQNMALIENYLDGYTRKRYEHFLTSFAELGVMVYYSGTKQYDYLGIERETYGHTGKPLNFDSLPPKTQEKIENEVAAELNTYSDGIRGSNRLREWIRIGIAFLMSPSGSRYEQLKPHIKDFEFAVRKNTLCWLLSTRERKERYILSLSDREWDLLKLQIQKKQYDEFIEEMREQGEKNRRQSAGQAWISIWNAERIKSSIDRLNDTLRINQPTYYFTYP